LLIATSSTAHIVLLTIVVMGNITIVVMGNIVTVRVIGTVKVTVTVIGTIPADGMAAYGFV